MLFINIGFDIYHDALLTHPLTKFKNNRPINSPIKSNTKQLMMKDVIMLDGTDMPLSTYIVAW